MAIHGFDGETGTYDEHPSNEWIYKPPLPQPTHGSVTRHHVSLPIDTTLYRQLSQLHYSWPSRHSSCSQALLHPTRIRRTASQVPPAEPLPCLLPPAAYLRFSKIFADFRLLAAKRNSLLKNLRRQTTPRAPLGSSKTVRLLPPRKVAVEALPMRTNHLMLMALTSILATISLCLRGGRRSTLRFTLNQRRPLYLVLQRDTFRWSPSV